MNSEYQTPPPHPDPLIFLGDFREKLNNQALMYMYSFVVFKYVNLIQQKEKMIGRNGLYFLHVLPINFSFRMININA